MNTVGDREVRSLLQILAIWSCHIWLVIKMKFASILGQGILIYHILLFFRPSSGIPNMTEILLTGM